MLSQPQAKQAILNLIVANFPRDTWSEIGAATGWAYQEAWSSTRDDPRFERTPGQRRFRASQERHFLMEGAIAEVAARGELPFVDEVVNANQWTYGMIRTPAVCIMQKKVRDGKEPPPAEFRRQVTAANSIVRQGDLFTLGDHHVSGDQPIFGILIHTPESQDFEKDGFGRPSFVRLAFPFGDYSGWAATFALQDLLSGYMTASEAPAKPRPAPTWKTRRDRKDGTDEANG